MTHDSNLHAYDRIRDAIVEGRYRPGERLIAQRIADELDLSRTPIREALRTLEAEGLVVIETNRGAMVRPIGVADVADLYGLRSRLESLAAYWAGSRRQPEHLSAMDVAIRAFDRAIPEAAKGSASALRTLNAGNRDFHGSVLEAAQSDRLAVLLRRATDVPLVYQAFRHFDRDSLRRSNLFHRLIRDAIAAGDGARAERLMAEHIDQGRDVLLAELAGRDSVDILFEG